MNIVSHKAYTIRNNHLRLVKFHHAQGTIDRYFSVRIKTIAGYCSRKSGDVLYITPRGYVYALRHNPESTRFCYKVILDPVSRYPDWHGYFATLTGWGAPRAYKRAAIKRYYGIDIDAL